jgi:hypothetical protein
MKALRGAFFIDESLLQLFIYFFQQSFFIKLPMREVDKFQDFKGIEQVKKTFGEDFHAAAIGT